MKKNRIARIPRFFHDGEITVGKELELSKKASHHLIAVVRSRVDDRIDLFNGNGHNYEAVISDTGQNAAGKRATLSIQQATLSHTESALAISLVQAISRGDRMDSSIRQAIELGATSIQPIYSRHSAKVLDEKRTQKKMEHWQNIIISACEQSGRARVASLSLPVDLGQWIKNQQRANTGSEVDHENKVNVILSPTATQSLSSFITQRTTPLSACGLIIGPESGFDHDEIEAAVNGGIVDVQFGTRVLRTETAGPAAIAVLQSLAGDLNPTTTA